jgi:hypothetical protein
VPPEARPHLVGPFAKAGLERQMRRDPAVRSARVRLALDPTGVLTIQIAVEPHQGTGFEVNLEART